jgi:outer membrane immunogenic protein
MRLEKRFMRKFLLSTVGLLALGIGAPASAADLAVKAPPPAPLPVVYNWNGFYIGANGGWAQSRNCLDFITTVGAVIGDGCRDRSGGVVGGQIGYRWQFNQWVFGLEAQGDWVDLSSERISLVDPTFSTRVKTDGIGLFTAQLGWASNAWLFYIKGGAAVTSTRLDIRTTIGGFDVASASATRWGGTVGGGIEYGFAPNWSIGVEYNHLFMGNSDHSFAVINPFLVGGRNRLSQDIDMVTLRINYRFGGYSPPIAARY